MSAKTSDRTDLKRLVPYGSLAVRNWLMSKGVPRHSIDNWVKSEQLLSLAPGVYKRPEAALTWQGVVASLQRMGMDLVVGGTSALELHGYAHYLSLSSHRTIHLYGYDRLPAWLNKLGLKEVFKWHGNARLWAASNEALWSDTIISMPWGEQQDGLKVSSAERAICEALSGVPEKISFEHAEQIMQGLTTLSPRRLEVVLHRLKHVKAKRLFFWLAERQGYAWFKKLDPDRFDLGHGKRVIVKGGRLDRKYLITVPEESDG